MTAGNGDTTIWQQSVSKNSAGDISLTALLSDLDHEFGHNADSRATPRGRVSSSVQWQRAGYDDWENMGIIPSTWAPSGRRGGRASQIVLEPKHERRLPHIGYYPNGVTRYGRASDHEDFAEALSLYLQGAIGSAELQSRPGVVQPVWFRDLFPGRAAIFDQMFPDAAQDQLEEIRRHRR